MIALRDRGIETRKVAVESLEDFAARPRGECPGVVVLDLNLGRAADGRRIKGYDWIPRLRASGWPVLTVTGSGHDGDTAAAIARGAVGVVYKSSSLDLLLSSVMQTAQGEPLISDAERRDWERKHRVRSERREQVAKRMDELTRREREVLEEIALPRQYSDDV